MSKKEDENALLSFSMALAAKDESTIRVYQRQEHEWSALGGDAEVVAQIVYRTSSALRRIGSNHTAMCSMNTTLFRNFLIDALQQRGLRVEVYEQESSGRSRWKSLPKEASPGNLQAVEDWLGSQVDQVPMVVAVKTSGSDTGERRVGVCFIDAESRRIGLTEFVDNDLFSNLESLVIQLGAKEVLLPEEDRSPDSRRIQEMMSRLDILVTPRKPAQFSGKDVGADIVRLTGKSEVEMQTELAQETSLGAANAALKFLGVMSQSVNFGQYSLERHDLNQYMRLDSSALRALNVMPSPRDGAKTMSLFGLLNQCNTTAGARLLAQWLKQPLMSIEEITERHTLVQEFIDNAVLRSTVQDDLMHAVPDLGKVTRRFHAGKAKLEDVVRIYHLAIRLPEFTQELESCGNSVVDRFYTQPLAAAQTDLGKLVELVEATIDLVALERHEYAVKADFDENLVALKEQRVQAYADMESELESVIDELGTDKVKLEDNPTLGWSFRLTRTDAGILRGKQGYIDLKTQKAGQIFTTKRLRTLATMHQELGEQYSKAQSSVSREVVNIASTYLPVLGPLGATLAHLDVIMSFASVSAFAKLPYVRPQFGDSFELKQARHPCMEVQTDMMFIPNDVSLVRNESEFNLITGPNMGGKSTYIRQVGVITLMAQIGCFVPCDSAQVVVVDSVLARVGAGDSQLKGISTFMAEMLETASILKTATPRSLIIVDELGRGTSTYDGFGLAWAISQHIVESLGCWCLFATHFHELTALADKYPSAANLHVVADTENSGDDITLLYKVEPGISAQSFGIHVAEVVHFPTKVVRMAKRRVAELEELDQTTSSSEDLVKGNALLNNVLHEWAEAGPEDGVKRLRAAIEAHKPEFEKNSYLKQVLASL